MGEEKVNGRVEKTRKGHPHVCGEEMNIPLRYLTDRTPHVCGKRTNRQADLLMRDTPRVWGRGQIDKQTCLWRDTHVCGEEVNTSRNVRN